MPEFGRETETGIVGSPVLASLILTKIEEYEYGYRVKGLIKCPDMLREAKENIGEITHPNHALASIQIEMWDRVGGGHLTSDRFELLKLPPQGSTYCIF